MIKRIRKIDILGVDHKVKYVNDKDNGGYYYPSDKKIEINTDSLSSEEEFLKTLIHEGGHGVLYLNGVHQDITLPQEHAIIDSMITFLFSNFEIKLKKKRK